VQAEVTKGGRGVAETRTHKQVEPDVHQGKSRRDFMRALLQDVVALERMLVESRFEKNVRRIGAEQEMFLIDSTYQATPGALKMLDAIADPHFTTELGMFQLEMNADPQLLGGDGFSRLERQMTDLMEKARAAGEKLGITPVLAGILPTLRKGDLGLDNMVPSPRYKALSKAVLDMRGHDFEFSINGIDELLLKHDSVMVEACNSSFQVHLQVGPEEFARLYNLAQVLAGPLLSCATNSPLLFGKRLWAETRIALFQQAVDTRAKGHHLRESFARVNFGSRFVRDSVLEIYKEDIARFRTLVGTDLDENPLEKLARGEAPQLKALRLHNGTIYRWNRACYGVADGKAHLRIENRVMPAGPTVVDEMANAALWCGVMMEWGQQYEDITRHIEFDQAQANFHAAAREGLGAHFAWLDGQEIQASALLLEKLLPAAEAGLRKQKVDEADIKRYLGVVEARVSTGRTGSRWLLSSLSAMKGRGTAGERQNALVAATVQRQGSGRPVSEWERARLDEAAGSKANYLRVDQIMTTDLFTVRADDAVDLVANLMGWERIRHVPVEDDGHRLVGLVSYRQVLRFLVDGGSTKDASVGDIMKTGVQHVAPETSTLDAINLMRRYRIGCLPVLHDGRLVGIINEENFTKIAGELLEQKLKA
jgi:CBS domain-containing protein